MPLKTNSLHWISFVKQADISIGLKKFRRPLLVFLTLFFQVLFAYSDGNDSLKNILKSQVRDTVFYKAAVDLAWNYMYSDNDSALNYARLSLETANLLSDKLKKVNALNTIGVCYIVNGNYFEAMHYLKTAKEEGMKLLEKDSSSYKYNRRMLSVCTNLGNVYYYLGEYDNAISNYLIALSLSKKVDFLKGRIITLSNIGASYKDLLIYDKALEYQYQALSLSKKVNDIFAVTQALTNLGSIFFSMENYDSAYIYFVKSVKANEKEGKDFELIVNYINMGDVLRNLGRYDSSYYYYRKGLVMAKKLNSTNGIINGLYMLGQYFSKIKRYDSALIYFNRSLDLAEKSGTLRFIMLANEELAKTYEKSDNYKKAYEHYKNGRDAAETIFSEERDKRIADMETKYRTLEKENRIKFLTEKNKLLDEIIFKTKLTLGSSLIILLLIIVLILISFRAFRLKQLAERRKMQQENERKLLHTVIQTEYNERHRFSSDLHDGLGVLLSTLRLYINELKNVSAEKREEIVNRSNKLVDEAIKNARNISNNIMPAVLKNNGLIPALQSFADKINATGKINVKLKPINCNVELNKVTELSLYRIITELVNNTLKHADASEIKIDIIVKEGKMFIYYSDNGKGFDYKNVIASKSKGQGLHNIKNRIQSIGGKCSFQSKPGAGFQASIEVILE